MEPFINRYAFTDRGPAQIWSKRELSTAQARKIFESYGLTVTRFVPNWSHFIGWVGVIEIDDPKLVREVPCEVSLVACGT
jgi:hypothetical protein